MSDDDIRYFDIVVHGPPRILEVIYPARVVQVAVDEYAQAIRTAILRQGTTKWACLVDQRALTVIPPEVVPQMAELNTFAGKHGMICSARVVANKVSGLQTNRLARESGSYIAAFEDRNEAIRWIHDVFRREAARR